MIFLNEPIDQIKNEWFERIQKKINLALADEPKCGFKDYISDNLRKIILGSPEEIFNIQIELFNKVYENKLAFDLDDYFSFLKYKNTAEKSRINKEIPNDYSIYETYYKDIEIIAKIFDYEKFISDSKSLSYWLTDKLNIQCCPYCNRNYIFTIGELNNDENRIVRPDLDHYYPKSKFPLLALSLYNLIPSCSICNSSIKGAKYLDHNNSFHPYIKYEEYNFKFDYQLDRYNKYKISFDYSNDNKIKKHFEDFKLEEIYDAHSNFELYDIMNLSLKNNKNRLLEIKNLLNDEDLFYGTFGIDPKFIFVNNNRPLSKLKYDIIKKNIELSR